MSALAVSTSIILPLPSSPHCIPIKIVLAMEIRNGQKIFPTHPEGSSRDLPIDSRLAKSRRKNFPHDELLLTFQREKGLVAPCRIRSSLAELGRPPPGSYFAIGSGE